MKLQFFICFFSILFLSCAHDEGDFLIINNSDFDIESLMIQPDSKNKSIKISKGEKKNFKACMNKKGQDGSYLLSFKNAKTKELTKHRFGYYTNGYQTEKNITVTITNDTIITKSDFHLNYKE